MVVILQGRPSIASFEQCNGRPGFLENPNLNPGSPQQYFLTFFAAVAQTSICDVCRAISNDVNQQTSDLLFPCL